jgi:hypothetical protein
MIIGGVLTLFVRDDVAIVIENKPVSSDAAAASFTV